MSLLKLINMDQTVYKQTINKWIEILNETFIRFKCYLSVLSQNSQYLMDTIQKILCRLQAYN